MEQQFNMQAVLDEPLWKMLSFCIDEYKNNKENTYIALKSSEGTYEITFVVAQKTDEEAVH